MSLVKMKCSRYFEKYSKTDIGLLLDICSISIDQYKGITLSIFVSSGTVLVMIEPLIIDVRTWAIEDWAIFWSIWSYPEPCQFLRDLDIESTSVAVNDESLIEWDKEFLR